MQKRLAAPSRVNTRVRARGLRSDGYWEEIEIGKRWRLARGGDWQEVEVSKRWRLARGGDWQEVEVGKRWRLARGGGWQEGPTSENEYKNYNSQNSYPFGKKGALTW